MENSTVKKETKKFQLPRFITSNPGMLIIGSLLTLNLIFTGFLLWDGKQYQNHNQYTLQKDHRSYGKTHESYTSCINGDCKSHKETREMTEQELYNLQRDILKRQQAFDRYFYEQRRIMDEFWNTVW